MTTSTASTGTFTTILGQTIGDTITTTAFGTPHNWTADSTGLFTTATNLAAEWQSDYLVMLAGNGASLTAIQRLEGNAEAVFLNTGLNKLSAAQQEIDREDVQRQFDAMAAAMEIDQKTYGVDPNAPLTAQSYLQMEQTIQSSPVLEELAMQGHGLNNSGISRYAGYTNDFQNGVDATTKFIGGGGLNNNANAITDFFDDNILSHVPFATVYQNGQLEQLNQNGAVENTLNQAIVALNDSMYVRTYTAADFSTSNATTATNKLTNATIYNAQDQLESAQLVIQESGPAPSGEIRTLEGALISNTMTFNDGNGITHTWTANANGLFTTTTNLAAEWQAAYVDYVTTGGADLTAEQRLEANAEAVFENTGLDKLSAAQQQIDREDVQRQFDAEFAAMKAAGVDTNATITSSSYLAIQTALRDSPALEELAIQGHGLNDPSSLRYDGYTNDFQTGVDAATTYVGGSYDNGQNALTDFFDDSILGHLPFTTVVRNGALDQLNQNGAVETSLATSVGEINRAINTGSFYSQDFSNPSQTASTTTPTTPTTIPANSFVNIYGYTISDAITTAVNDTLHNWTADSTGLFTTTTNLAAEWQADYATMLAGNGASLTAIQRLEGNAEAVFENTGLSKLSAAQQEVDREDVQRQFDAMSAAMTIDAKLYGIDPNAPLTAQSYLQIEQTIQSSPVLEELALQGHGLNNSGIARYAGYTNDFQNNVDQTTLFIGGGTLNNNAKAIADFFDDNILSHVPFPTVYENGQLVQLNQNGADENTLNQAIVALNDSMYVRTYTAADFSTKAATTATNKLTSATIYTAQDQLAQAQLVVQESGPAPAGEIRTLEGALISNTMTFNDGNGIVHTWTANAQGLFTTTTNLAAEWHAAYVDYVTTGGADLTAEQKMEANAESVFENTGLNKLSAAQQQIDREDVQRQLDAEFGAMKIAGINPNAALTATQYLTLEHTLQGNAALEELAIQGHGLNDPSSIRYEGYTNDFQTGVDATTTYIGGSYNSGQNALTDFFDDSILGHMAFPTVIENGKLEQLNQNGAAENSLTTAVAEFNRSITKSFYAANYKKA